MNDPTIVTNPDRSMSDLSGTFDGDDGEGIHHSLSSLEGLENLSNANEETNDYYSMLGLARHPPPSVAQIRMAYHRASLALHPDKHPHVMKSAAEKHFARLQKAYEVLISPQKRIIYDLEGEVGVQEEYKLGGAMSTQSSHNQVGIKSMTPQEFKQWYMNLLRTRERKAIEDLVGTNGACKLTLNATKLFDTSSDSVQWLPVNGDSGEVNISHPRLFIAALNLGQSFDVPLRMLGALLEIPFRDYRQTFYVEGSGDQSGPARSAGAVANNAPILRISTGVGGTLQDHLVLQDGDDVALAGDHPDPLRWQSLHTEDIRLTAGIEHTFSIQSTKSPASIASLLQGTNVEVECDVLPARAVGVGLSRSIPFWPEMEPAHVLLKANFCGPLHKMPPVMEFRVAKSLGSNQTGLFSISSGFLAWPRLITSILPLSRKSIWMMPGPLQDPTCICRWSLDENNTMPDAGGVEVPDHAPQGDSTARLPVSANRTWHVTGSASRMNAVLSVTYGRDLFVSRPYEKSRSRFSVNGEASINDNRGQQHFPHGIRLEIEGDLGLNTSFGGAIRAKRRSGEFSTIAFGVGLNAQQGLYLSLSWHRLGQNFSLPIILHRNKDVDLRAMFYAVAIPTIVYGIVEFLIIRPRLRRARHKLLKNELQKLDSTVVRKRQEAFEAIALIRATVEHKQVVELGNDGLVIVRATFGVSHATSPGNAKFNPKDSADVTLAVAALVENGQISVPRGVRKAQLLGFYDPAPLARKVLAVRYLFAGKEHYTELRNSRAMKLPMRDHEIRDAGMEG